MAQTLRAKRDRRIFPPDPEPVEDPGIEVNERALELCDSVIDILAAYFNISGRELRAPGRGSRPVARVRQIGMYVAHVVMQVPMADVGRAFGRDRSTVTYACHLVEDLREDRDFEDVISAVERVLKAVLERFGGRRP